jgi:hypothetical protein
MDTLAHLLLLAYLSFSDSSKDAKKKSWNPDIAVSGTPTGVVSVDGSSNMARITPQDLVYPPV